MFARLKLRVGIAAMIPLLYVGAWSPAHAAEKCETPAELRFSLIPAGDVEKRIRMYRVLFARLEALTGRPVSVVRPSSYASVVEGLLAGSIDIATLGPAGYVDATRNDPRITPFATYEKRGGVFQSSGPYYHAFLVTLAQSPYSEIAALKGSHLGLTDPGSTSGSLLPREEFTPRLGMPLEQYFGAVSFTGNHVKSIDALLRGDVDAAFIASTQLEEALQAGKLTQQQIRILWQSAPIPYDPFVWRGQLCAPLKKQIRAAFFDAPQALRSLLDEISSSRFVPIGDSHYAGIRKVLDKPPK